MRLLVACLMSMLLLVVIVLPVMSYSQHPNRDDHANAAAMPTCLANLRSGPGCESAPETRQAMVLIRGQLLALPSERHQ